MRIGFQQLLIILGIAILIFGPSQIPKLRRTFDKAAQSYKDGEKEAEKELAEKRAKKKLRGKQGKDSHPIEEGDKPSE